MVRRRRRRLSVSGLPIWLDRAGESDSVDLRSRSTADTAESVWEIAGGDCSTWLRDATGGSGCSPDALAPGGFGGGGEDR